MANEKTSIIKEALTDYNEIREAADANAKKKLAEEFPEKFSNLLKEELQNKNKSKKESYKKLDESKESKELDESELNKESVMKNQTKETVKVVKENAGKDGVFNKKPKMPDMVKEEREKEFMADVENDTPNQGKGELEKGVVFKEKLKGPTSGKPISNIKEEFDITELDMQGVGSALENAGDEDEVITMDEIEDSIYEMEGLGQELQDMSGLPRPELQQRGNPEGQKGDAFNQLVNMRSQIDEIINGMEGLPRPDTTPYKVRGLGVNEANPPQDTAFPSTKMNSGRHPNDNIYRGNEPKGVNEANPPQDTAFPPTKMKTGKNPNDNIYRGNEPKGVNEANPPQDTAFPSTKMNTGRHPNDNIYRGNEPKGVNEEGEITDADVMAVLGGNDGEVDESHGVTYAERRKVTGRHTPSTNRLAWSEIDQSPEYVQESNKKIGTLISENKNLTKKLNEIKKYKQSVTTLVEQYKTALDKYRNQLKEMATFNTNLAHVNNLLVNESLALTQGDKIKIINEFKKVDSIAESQKKYKSFLTEMKGSKATLTESIENKVTASVAPSSKQKLDEVVEKTAYENNDHLKRMKKIIETIEHRGKKNNL